MSVSVKLKWDGAKALDIEQAQAEKALFLAAEHVIFEANKTVPFDIAGRKKRLKDGTVTRSRGGTLMRSGDTDVDGNNLSASMFYNTKYGPRLHEHPEYNFQGAPKRRGKWLELTLTEQKAKIEAIFAKAINF